MRTTIASIAVLGLLGCAAPPSEWRLVDADFYLGTTVPAEVMETAKAAEATGRFSTWQLQRVDRYQFQGGPSGTTTEYQSEVTIRREEGGLTREVTRQTQGTPTSLPWGVMEIRQLSLCGLEPLSRQVTGDVVVPNNSAVVVGGTTFSSSRGVRYSPVSRLLADSLSQGAAKVCAPKPGTEYTYQVSRQYQQRNVPTRNNVSPFAGDVKCRTADAKFPAASIVPGIDGDALEIRCAITYKVHGVRTNRFAYVELLGSYLPLEVDEPERGTTQYRYLKAVSSTGT